MRILYVTRLFMTLDHSSIKCRDKTVASHPMDLSAIFHRKDFVDRNHVAEISDDIHS